MLTHSQRFISPASHNPAIAHQGVAATDASACSQGLLHQVIHRGVTAQGEPFAVALILDPIGQTLTANAYASRYGDLSGLDAREGQEVGLQRTPTGLQLMPPATSDPDGAPPSCAATGLQPLSQCPGLQEVATTVAAVARDLKLPTAVWIHLP